MKKKKKGIVLFLFLCDDLCHTYLWGTTYKLNLFTLKLCFSKYDSPLCVCVCARKQETEEYIVNDVMSVRVLLEARMLSTRGHKAADDKWQSHNTNTSGLIFHL